MKQESLGRYQIPHTEKNMNKVPKIVVALLASLFVTTAFAQPDEPAIDPGAIAAAVTAIVVGSIVHSLPPSCQTVMSNGFAYQQCGNTWYQPQISGSSTTYIVVNAP